MFFERYQIQKSTAYNEQSVRLPKFNSYEILVIFLCKFYFAKKGIRGLSKIVIEYDQDISPIADKPFMAMQCRATQQS